MRVRGECVVVLGEEIVENVPKIEEHPIIVVRQNETSRATRE